MSKIYYITVLIFLLNSCKYTTLKYKQFEVTYEDGTTEVFIEEHWCSSDGKFKKFKISEAGCLKVPGQFICGVKTIKY